MTKTWLPLPGLTGHYEVSSRGGIRSLERVVLCGPSTGSGTRTVRQRIMRQQMDRYGYPTVTIHGRKTTVHRLVATTFIPNPDGLKQINHRSGDKTDNSVANLEWCTAAQNVRHSHDVLGRNTGDNCFRSKLTSARVREARALRKQGVTYRELAERFSVHISTIYHAVDGRSWRRVS